jgi:hypothetical protein
LDKTNDQSFQIFNMVMIGILLISHCIAISKTLISKYNLMFYLLNGAVIVILMLNKIFGFEKAWERRNKLIVSTLLLTIGISWLGFLFKTIYEYGIEEVRFVE